MYINNGTNYTSIFGNSLTTLTPKNPDSEVDALFASVKNYLNSGENDQALAVANKGLKNFSSQRTKCLLYLQIAFIYQKTNQFAKALASTQTALIYSKGVLNQDVQGKIHSQLSYFSIKCGDYLFAHDSAAIALKFLTLSAPVKRDLQHRKASALKLLNRPKEYISELMSLLQSSQNPQDQAVICMEIGKIFYYINDFKNAMKFLNKANDAGHFSPSEDAALSRLLMEVSLKQLKEQLPADVYTY